MTGCASRAVRWSRDRASPARAGAPSCVAGRSWRCRRACHRPACGLLASGVHDRQAPAPSGELAGDGHDADGGALAAAIKPAPALVQPAVAALGSFPDHGRLASLAALQLSAGTIRLAVVPGALDRSRRAWVVPVLVIDPWTRWVPLECSAGTSPRSAPILAPVNRSPSPTSTASPNAVNTPTPRRQPSRPTSGAQAVSWRARRWPHPAGGGAPGRPAPPHRPRRRRPSRPPGPTAAGAATCRGPGSRRHPRRPAHDATAASTADAGPHQVDAGVLPGPNHIPCRLLGLVGTPTAGSSQCGAAERGVRRRGGRS
jgi:hypothetical protein